MKGTSLIFPSAEEDRRCNLKCLTKFILTFVVKSHTEQRITFLSMEILGMSSISEGEKVSLDLPNRETLIPLGRAFLGITAKKSLSGLVLRPSKGMTLVWLTL